MNGHPCTGPAARIKGGPLSLKQIQPITAAKSPPRWGDTRADKRVRSYSDSVTRSDGLVLTPTIAYPIPSTILGERAMTIRQIACILLLLSYSAFAAEPTGTITGTVTDPSGASIVGAKLTVTNTGIGLVRETTSATDGGYVFPLLPVGTYNVNVESTGFRRFEQHGVTVKADASSSVPVTLQIGSLTDTVTVEANAERIDTRSGQEVRPVARFVAASQDS